MRRANQSIEQYIRSFVDTASSQLAPYVLQGKLNNEFIRGKQNRKINPRQQTIEDCKKDPEVYTERKVFNRLLPIYLTRYGILTQNMPIPGIEAFSNTSKAVKDSIVANKFVVNFMADSNFRNMYKRAIKHADIYGGCWFKTGIDWSAGELIGEVEASIGETTGKVQIKEGRPFTTPVPIYEVFVDSLQVESIEDVNELVHRRVFSIDYIKKRWGVDVPAESIAESRLATYPRYSNFGGNNAGDIEYAYLYEYYKKPDAIYPEGRYVIMCGGKILYDGKLPYKNGVNGTRQIPFDFFSMQSLPNYLIGVTVYSQLIPIQETYNAVKNRYLEYVNHIAIGQMFYWEGSLINKNNFTTKPGKLIGLKRNARAPQPVQKDKLSNEFISYLKAIEEDMLITAGLSQMTAFGTSKSNVRTDGVVDKLSESDENKLSNALDNISDCFISMFKKIIYLEKERVDILTQQLKLAKIDSYALQYNLTDVDAEQLTIVNRDFLMQSDQLFDKKLQQANAMGVYAPNSPMTYQSKLEFLNALHASFLRDTLDPQERATHDLCEEENVELYEKDIMPKAEDFHVHAQHISEHNLYRISPEIRQLKHDDPERYKQFQQKIEIHIKEHREFLEKQAESSQNFDGAKAALSTAR